MGAERTLVVDLDKRIKNSPRFHANSVGEYFKNSKLEWWRPIERPYIYQELRIQNWLKNKHFRHALEIGPGFGRITRLISPHTENLTLVEVNKRALNNLHKEFASARILDKPIERFKFGISGYNLIAAIEVLVHIPDIPALLDKIGHSLTKGGLFITSITPDSYYENRRTVIHRGINPTDFEEALCVRRLPIIEKASSDQTTTYFCRKVGAEG